MINKEAAIGNKTSLIYFHWTSSALSTCRCECHRHNLQPQHRYFSATKIILGTLSRPDVVRCCTTYPNSPSTPTPHIHHTASKKPVCNEKAYIERKYILTDSTAVLPCVCVYTCRCTTSSCIIDYRWFRYFEIVSKEKYGYHNV